MGSPCARLRSDMRISERLVALELKRAVLCCSQRVDRKAVQTIRSAVRRSISEGEGRVIGPNDAVTAAATW